MRVIDLIQSKKIGKNHTKKEIDFLINGFTSGEIPDYQVSAWLMAVYFQGMSFEENALFTEAMANSGQTLDLSSIGEHVVDKHSTGGVGDKTTLILIPLLAAAGIPVAKLSGRGLGHTGGTIDKLESIPGFKTNLSLEEFLTQIKTSGMAIAGQTAQLTPADGRLYALRDVTATVDSIPLIASSVVSKKIASGANAIVLDVKVGSGAFIKDLKDAEILAKTMVEIGKRLNRKISAVLTSMEQPLGQAIGNSLEVIEAIDILKNKGSKDLKDLTLYLGAVSLVDIGVTPSIDAGIKILETHLQNGSALNKFKELLKIQNGDISVIDDYSKLPTASIKYEYKSKKSGFIEKIEAIKIAKACKLLGAGRDKKGDPIDFAVGIWLEKKVSEQIKKNETLLIIHANDENKLNEAISIIDEAITISETPIPQPILIYNTFR